MPNKTSDFHWLYWLVGFSCWPSHRGHSQTFTHISPVWTEMLSHSSPKLRYVHYLLLWNTTFSARGPPPRWFSHILEFLCRCRNHSGMFNRYSTQQRATFISWWHYWTAGVWIRWSEELGTARYCAALFSFIHFCIFLPFYFRTTLTHWKACAMMGWRDCSTSPFTLFSLLWPSLPSSALYLVPGGASPGEKKKISKVHVSSVTQ